MLTAAIAPPSLRHTLMQGEHEVSGQDGLVLSTILGSCIACCLHDRSSAIGGMNHFLLPAPPDGLAGRGGDAERYGLFAMEVLVNAMLKRGATRSTMRAHLYGGANLHVGMRAIGSENARFARAFLAADGIALAHEDTGGGNARRIEFQPATGRVRCRAVVGRLQEEPVRAALPVDAGHVELF